MNRRKLYLWLHGGGWTVAVLMLFGLRLVFSSQLRVTFLEIANWTLYALSGIFLTNQLRIRTRHWLDLSIASAWYRYLGSTLLVGLVLGIQVTLVGPGWRILAGARFPFEFFFGTIINTTFVVFMWTALYIAIVNIRRLAEAQTRALQLELAAKEARLKNLRAQVNPHFLFNGLNTVRALIAEDPAKATEAVTWLASILRYGLRSDDAPTVTIAEELEMVTQYLALEKLRFEKRLTTSIDVDDAVLTARIPPLILQTITENAIKHGIANLPNGGAVNIEIRRASQRIEMSVRNTGALSSHSPESGIGLKNTRERLHLLYGSDAVLQLTESNNEVIAQIILPESRQ